MIKFKETANFNIVDISIGVRNNNLANPKLVSGHRRLQHDTIGIYYVV